MVVQVNSSLNVKHQKPLFKQGNPMKIKTAARQMEWPWRGAPEYGEARAERNSIFARIWRNVIKCTIFSMIVLLRN